MVDNTGLYVTYAQLLEQMRIAGNSKVTTTALTLANKVVDVSGDIYEFSGAGTPLVGDAISQGGRADTIIEILSGPDRIRIIKTGAENVIANGPVNLMHSDDVPRFYGEDIIQTQMDFIDEQTRQFFNKRTFDDTNPVKFEGNNTALLLLGVPIISIDKLLINSSDTELFEGEDLDFFAFKGRQRPQDDRKNPRIKLNLGRGRDSIFTGTTSRLFVNRALTHIEGSFGYLEQNGSTPLLIQKAIIKLSVRDINVPFGGDLSSSSSGALGPMKRLKVDLHEEEFFELKENTSAATLSGDQEVDRIIAKYRSPIGIGGSFPVFRRRALDRGRRERG